MDDLTTKVIDMVANNNAPALRRQEENMESYLGYVEETTPALSQAHFEKHFLPYFLSGEYTEEMIAVWVNKVAGTVMSPVRILNTEGECVVVVPAIVDTSQIMPDPGQDSRETISHAAAEFIQNSGTFGVDAERQLGDQLINIMDKKIRPSTLTTLFHEYYKDYKVDGVESDEVTDTDTETFDPSDFLL